MKLTGLIFFFAFCAYGETFKINGQHRTFELKNDLLQHNCSVVTKPITCESTVFGIAENGDGRAFCVLKDECLIESNSLRAIRK